jgi:hypothetical protein
MWMIEMFLDSLSVDFVSVRSTMQAQERISAVKRFTSGNNRCSALVTTFNCGGTGLNLHDVCARVIVMEPAMNLNTLFQAIDRVQVSPQKVWILFQNHTFSRYQEHNNTRKILPQIAAQLRHRIQDKVTAELQKAKELVLIGDVDPSEERPDEDIAVEGENEVLEGSVIDKFANEHLQKLLGQRFSSLAFENAEDLGNREHASSQKKRKRSDESDQEA